MRDRLDSMSEDEHGGGNSAPGIGRNMSRSFVVPGGGGGGAGNLPVNHDQEEEPYAWISQTAPSSPRNSRSRYDEMHCYTICNTVELVLTATSE